MATGGRGQPAGEPRRQRQEAGIPPAWKRGAVGSCAVSGSEGDVVFLGPHWPGPITSALLWGGCDLAVHRRGGHVRSGEGRGASASPAPQLPLCLNKGTREMRARLIETQPFRVSCHQQQGFCLTTNVLCALGGAETRVRTAAERGLRLRAPSPARPPHTPTRRAGRRRPASPGVGVAFPGGIQPFRSREGREGLISSADGHCSAARGREARGLCPPSPWQPQKTARACSFAVWTRRQRWRFR